MEIKELTSDLINDWFDFFENRAFSDHNEWHGCYCTACYYPKPSEYNNQSNRKKEYAKWLINTGRMCGYLAYEDNKVVGWVNANNKIYFTSLSGTSHHENILSIVCFIVEKEYRGKGIATRLLQEIVNEAKKKGYSIIEAYPKQRVKSEYGQWNGPYEMYKKNGFDDFKTDTYKSVRKYI